MTWTLRLIHCKLCGARVKEIVYSQWGFAILAQWRNSLKFLVDLLPTPTRQTNASAWHGIPYNIKTIHIFVSIYIKLTARAFSSLWFILLCRLRSQVLLGLDRLPVVSRLYAGVLGDRSGRYLFTAEYRMVHGNGRILCRLYRSYAW